MFDAKSLLDQFLGAGEPRGGQRAGAGGSDDLMARGRDFLSSQGGGLALGSLAGLLLGSKTGRKVGKKALTYGGMALVAGLAYKAYQGYRANQDGTTRPPSPADTPEALEAPKGTGFDPERAPGGAQAFAVTLLSAMIAAAKADGHVDAAEQGRIFDKIDEAGLDSDAKAFLMDELRAPLDLDRIVAGAGTPEQALEIYAASRLAIEPDLPAERAYLETLAARLGIEPDLVAEVDLAVREAQAGM